MAGTWDRTWQTRRGPERKGYWSCGNPVSLRAQIHGQGSVKAKG